MHIPYDLNLVVAPFMGAWIEIKHRLIVKMYHGRVAPFMGAWIEISPTRPTALSSTASHPSWVRGLKCKQDGHVVADLVVAPFMGAWIEIKRRP